MSACYMKYVGNNFFGALTGFVKFCLKTLGYKMHPKFKDPVLSIMLHTPLLLSSFAQV